MCGRFVDPNLRSEGADTSWLKINPYPRRYNVKPTNDVLVVGSDKAAAMARWWLIPSWVKGTDPKTWRATTFNARIEDARDKPTFRAAWRHGRCLIPAGGFYEWTGDKGGRQPHFIQLAGNEENLFFAGLSSEWRDILTCTIMTRSANDSMADIHNRMPVILNSDEREAWMGGSDDLGIGAGTKLRHHPVAPFGLRDDGPELVEPV